jgi:hypothetical protein
MSANRAIPPSTARAIIALSSIEPYGDPLTYEDLFGAVKVLRSEFRTPAKAEAWL